ncbi:RNA-dependent ATPase [Meristemomyces frigidus]|uniref:RNA helicase n=1 Tax=Meristemomyces frigidus TaxID=1508187 RepID=A0AAN7TM68_9PEZI|nr:RNA-dependent ATPase [Meristemomyces frigidus]
MSKRTHEDADKADGNKDARREAKRLKKESKAKSGGTVLLPSEEIGTETIAAQQETVDGAKELSKEERRALRKAEKEAARNTTSESVESALSSTNGDAEAAAKAARKAARKAAKAAQTPATLPVTNGHATDPAHAAKATSDDDQSGELSYVQDAQLSALPQSEIDAFIAEKQLAIEDPRKQQCRPITAFKYLPVDEAQLAPFAKFDSPTPIQSACWPYLLAGRDVVGVAETGSGKTLAFGVPCIRFIASLPKHERSGIKACIVSPTRELAMQIYEQLVKQGESAGVKVTVIYGGTSKDDQRRTIKGTHVVVATPGRLNDFVQEGSIDLSGVRYVVLDEADRMLDTGFEQEVRKIISVTAKTGRQTLMFTATWPPSVRELADTFMTQPVKVTIGDNASGELRANTRITQEVEVMTQFDKQNRLIELLKQYQSGKNKNDRILVFCLYKKEATRVEETIRRRGFNVAGIHGDLNQQQRTASLAAFKEGKVPVLVATDVAARGLDIPAVKHVINVTFPLTVEDYVHRIGRTGRAGQDGHAYTMFTDAEKGLAGALINVLKGANQTVPEELMKFGTTVKKKGHDAYGAFYKDTGDMKKATKITFD